MSDPDAHYRALAASFRARRERLGRKSQAAKGGYILFIAGSPRARISGLNAGYQGNPYYPVAAVVVPDDGSPIYVNKRTAAQSADKWEPL